MCCCTFSGLRVGLAQLIELKEHAMVESNEHDDSESVYRHFGEMSGQQQLRCVLVAFTGLLRLWRRLQRQSPELAATGYAPVHLIEWLFRVTRNDGPTKLQKRLLEAGKLETEAFRKVEELDALQATGPSTVALWQASATMWAFVHLFRGAAGALREDGRWYNSTDKDLPHYASGSWFSTPRAQAAHEFSLAVNNALHAMVGPLGTTVDMHSLYGARQHWWNLCKAGIQSNPKP